MQINHEIVKEYAILAHKERNAKYDDKPYSVHINMVVDIGKKFLHLIPFEEQDNVLGGCACHDVIEDACATYNNVKKTTNHQIAEIALACQNDPGRNRKERNSPKYYKRIRTTPYATFVKLCDRIANVLYSRSKGKESHFYLLYKKENEDFIRQLYDPHYKEMFDFLNNLFIES